MVSLRFRPVPCASLWYIVTETCAAAICAQEIRVSEKYRCGKLARAPLPDSMLYLSGTEVNIL